MLNFAHPEAGEPDHIEVCEVRHMALKELLAAMPEREENLEEVMDLTHTESDAFKMLFKLRDILY